MGLVYRGAEAELWSREYLSIPVIEKIRVPKKYRIKEIDYRIREERVKSECSMIMKARQAVRTPYILDIDIGKKSFIMEKLEGEKVKEIFLKDKQIKEISKKIGEKVGALHSINLIHGDLTTSNLIWDGDLAFVDFGLAYKSTKIEDKAVDLVVFKKMLKSTHFKHFNSIWDNFTEGYLEKGDKRVMERVKQVEGRGRYLDR